MTIVNRGEHGERFKNIQVHVGPNHVVRNNPVCHDRVSQAHDGEAVRLTCDPPIPGRFVGLQMYGKGILSMCEVIVASRLGIYATYDRGFQTRFTCYVVIVASRYMLRSTNLYYIHRHNLFVARNLLTC